MSNVTIFRVVVLLKTVSGNPSEYLTLAADVTAKGNPVTGADVTAHVTTTQDIVRVKLRDDGVGKPT